MKKILTTAFCLSVITLTSSVALANDWDNGNPPPRPPHMEQGQKPPMVNLDEYLNLTDKQKAQAKANRIKARKEMKPIMEEIHAKKEAILDVMDSDLSKAQQDVKIKALKEEIKALDKKANAIREQNMKDFESILTKQQKAKLEQFKKEHKPPQPPQGQRPPRGPME